MADQKVGQLSMLGDWQMLGDLDAEDQIHLVYRRVTSTYWWIRAIQEISHELLRPAASLKDAVVHGVWFDGKCWRCASKPVKKRRVEAQA